MQASVDQLKHEVEAIVGRSGLAERLLDVDIDPNDDPEMPFIRVNLSLRDIDVLSTKDALALMVAIENGLSEFDERFASVRFAEAA